MASSAAALDAADGRMDGRFFGRPIVAAGGPRPPVAGGSAAALDAADGRIDGKFFGRPIVQRGAPMGVPTVQRTGALVPYTGAPTVGAVGAYPAGYGYGVGYPTAPMMTGISTLGAAAVPAASYMPSYGVGGVLPGAVSYGGLATATPMVGGVSSAALALDAADGRIDGRSFGRPIVGGGYGGGIVGGGYGGIIGGSPLIGTSAIGAYPAMAGYGGYGGGVSTIGGIGYGGYGGYGGISTLGGLGGYGTRVVGMGGYGIGGGIGGYPALGSPVLGGGAVVGGTPGNRLALDAADGVIDGGFFGNRIL